MANYNNKFLVQHLQDLYALYIAEDKILQMCNSVDKEYYRLQRNPPRYPAKPVRESPSVVKSSDIIFPVLHMLLVGLSILLVILLFMLFPVEKDWQILRYFVIPILIMIIIDQPIRIKLRRDDEKANAEIRRINNKYEAEMRAYSRECKEIDRKIENEYANEKAKLSKISKFCWQEKKNVRELREKVYSANIIPRQYRDEYTIVYLYDYFESSGETDLAMALNTYVLEQIKERLDRIMDKLSEIVMNQYTMIRNQEDAMDQADRHHDEMMRRLSKIEANDEERNKYLKVIEGNTETLKYFATADYLWRR